MNRRFYLRNLACVVVVSTAAVAFSQTASDVDKKFVKAALEGGTAEIRLGQLAEQKSNSADVRQFGRRMVTDHTRMGDQMRQVAQQIGVVPANSISVSEKAVQMKLGMLSGDTFDKAYLKAMVKAHEDDLAAFNQEVATGTSPDVKHAAKVGTQTISVHLELAKQLATEHHVDFN